MGSVSAVAIHTFAEFEDKNGNIFPRLARGDSDMELDAKTMAFKLVTVKLK